KKNWTDGLKKIRHKYRGFKQINRNLWYSKVWVNRFLFNVKKGNIYGKIIERERTWKRNHTKEGWNISGQIYEQIRKAPDAVRLYNDRNQKKVAGRAVQR